MQQRKLATSSSVMANQRSSSFVLLSLLAMSLLLPSMPAASATWTRPRPLLRPPLRTIDSIFQFGDSLSDTGNLIRDSPIGAHNPCGSLPYGETHLRNSGRCSNGLLMIDFIANSFHLPLLSPYLNRGGDFQHGVNFAVAGSTALDTAALAAKGVVSPVTNSSLSVQLKWFNVHLDSICHGNSVCKQLVLHNSLVMMGETGGNDYNYALLEGKTMDDLHSMVPDVVQTIKEAVQEVINLGATRFVVPGNFPIGCMPIYLSLFQSNDTTMYDELGCLKGLNDFAKLHNDHLQGAIKELQQQNPNVAIVYGDYYSGLRGVLTNALLEGFDVVELHKACCGVNDNKYNFNMQRLCGGEGVPVCANPARRFSWDGIHLTEHAYNLMADYLLQSIVTIC